MADLLAFFRPPAAAPEAAILSAARALPGLSTGAITSPLLTRGNDGQPHPGGALSRPGWAHVDVAGGLVHPALGAAIARRLGWTEEDVWSVAYFHAYVDGGAALPLPPPEEEADPRLVASGPEALRRLLGPGSGLVLDAVPVTPAGTRPVVEMPGGARMPDLASVAYQDLVMESLRLRHLAERARTPALAPFVALQHLALQTAFEALCVRFGGAPGPRVPSRRRGWAFAAADRYWHPVPAPVALAAPPPELETGDDAEPSPNAFTMGETPEPPPQACAFLDASTALVCSAGLARVVSLSGGGVRAAHAIPPLLRLVAPAAGGRAAIFAVDGELFALDLATGAWLPDVEGAPLAAIAERAERALLVDARRTVAADLPEVVDYVDRWSASPTGELLWVEDRSGRGGVYAVATGLRVLDRAAWIDDAGDAPLLGGEGGDDTGDGVGPGPSAFTLGTGGRWRFLDAGLLVVDRTAVGRLAFAATAAAFDDAGDRLLLAAPGRLVIVDVGAPPRVAGSVPLR